MICINCQSEHTERYCPNCGQKSEIPEITFGSMFNAAFTTITNMDKGYLFNAKNLLLDPSKIVKDYIQGKRKNIFNPISFLIITVTLYLVAESFIDFSIAKINNDGRAFEMGYETGKFIKEYFKYFWIFSIIWLSLSTKLVFRRYNFAEHLAINSFVVGQATLIGLIIFVIFKLPLLFNPFLYIIIAWITYEIYKSKPKDIEVFLQSFTAILIFFILMILVTVLIGITRNYC